MNRNTVVAALLITAVSTFASIRAEETRLAVKHDHLWRSCEGQLVFSNDGIRYETKEAEHARNWKYEDIQQIGIEPKKVVILTYQDRKLYLGKDEKFTFEVTRGQVGDSLRVFLENKLSRPLVSSVLPTRSEVRYRIPVKHRKTLSGTQGVLEFSDRYVMYRTKDQHDARIWQYDQLVSVGSTGPYQLRITAMERTAGEFGGGKNFVFDLKERLTEAAYDYLWNKINRPRIDATAAEPESTASEVF